MKCARRGTVEHDVGDGGGVLKIHDEHDGFTHLVPLCKLHLAETTLLPLPPFTVLYGDAAAAIYTIAGQRAAGALPS